MPKSIAPFLRDLPDLLDKPVAETSQQPPPEPQPMVNSPNDPATDSSTPTSGYRFSLRSVKAMQGIHPDLKKVCYRAIELTTHDFVITEGLRTLAQQRINVKKGVSQTLHSRHLTGHAVDYVDYPGFTWNIKVMTEIAKAFKKASAELSIPIRWGGDWKGGWDSSHIELWTGKYPA